jgi:hypothetical protein
VQILELREKKMKEITGCEFSGEQKLLTFALVKAQSDRRVRCNQKNAWHAVAASTTKCA